MKKVSVFLCATLAVLPFCGSAQNINALLNDWSIVTSGNLQSINDYDGNAYVGGNITDGNSFTINAIGGSSNPVTLDVAGNVNNGININVNGHANVGVGGTINSNAKFNLNGGGQVTANDTSLPTSPVPELTSYSGSLAGLTANSQDSVAGNQDTFTCADGASVVVFNISAATMDDASQFALVTASSTTTVIINVNGNGGTLNITGNFLSSFSSFGNKVLFNFYNTANVDSDVAIYGYVLAPGATVDEQNDIYGGVFAENLTIGEVDLPSGGTVWAGNLPSVPEPATWISGVAMMGLLGVSFIRRKS